MKFRQTPGGTWCGTEATWKSAMKAEGLEFLTFNNVNVIAPRNGTEVVAGGNSPHPLPPAAAQTQPATSDIVVDLDALFAAAPMEHKLRLAVAAIDEADELIRRLVPANPRNA